MGNPSASRGVLGETKEVVTALTITLTAYTALDCVGGLQTIAISTSGGGVMIRNIYLVDTDNMTEPYNLYLFNDVPTTVANDAALLSGLADSDLLKMRAKVAIVAGDYVTITTSDGASDWANKDDLAIDMWLPNAKLYAYLECVATPDATNVDALTLIVQYWEN